MPVLVPLKWHEIGPKLEAGQTFRLKVRYIWRGDKDETTNEIIRTIQKFKATERVFACEVDELHHNHRTANLYEVEVDFVDTVKSNKGSYFRRFTDVKEFQEMLSELEEICKDY